MRRETYLVQGTAHVWPLNCWVPETPEERARGLEGVPALVNSALEVTDAMLIEFPDRVGRLWMADLAELLGWPVPKVRHLVYNGKLTAEKIGGRWYVSLESLQAHSSLWRSIELKDVYES